MYREFLKPKLDGFKLMLNYGSNVILERFGVFQITNLLYLQNDSCATFLHHTEN